MQKSERPQVPAEQRNRERPAMRAGLVRITLGGLGLVSSFFVPLVADLRWAFAAYLALAALFQWVIQRRFVRTISRALLMGLVDMLFTTALVHHLGSLHTALPLVYGCTPVLYATSTARRRVSMTLAVLASASFALLVLLEQLQVLSYAPSSPELSLPGVTTAAATVVFVATCTMFTAVLTAQLIAALDAANSRLRDLSQHDELTGLYNRRFVMERLADELSRIKRKPALVTAAMVDLDGFKRVNDEIGHDAGDAVLKAVAKALLSATRRADVVARYGGDEFVILLPDTEIEGARAVSARILDQARDSARSVCPSIPVSASIGITVLQESDEPADVFRRVDEQLYAAKRAGGDRVSTG